MSGCRCMAAAASPPNDEQMERQLAGWVEQGITAMKMKVGSEPDRGP